MALATYVNRLNQTVRTLVWDAAAGEGGAFVEKAVGPRQKFEVDDEHVSPLLEQQVLNGAMKKRETAA